MASAQDGKDDICGCERLYAGKDREQERQYERRERQLEGAGGEIE